MNHFELASPSLREPRGEYTDFAYQVLARCYLPIPEELPSMSLVDTLSYRRSRRRFGCLDPDDLSTLLWMAGRSRGRRVDPSGRPYQIRATPSAGGIHPIDVMVVDHAALPPKIHLYDPSAHALCELCIADHQQLDVLLDTVNDILPTENGTVIWFVAQFGRTMAKYIDGESLVWRDAGALLAVFCLVGESIGLSCCAIGITGEPAISAALGGPDRLRGVGGLAVGARSHAE